MMTDSDTTEQPSVEGLQEEIAGLRQHIRHVEAAARELAAQRDMLGERAANLAGELARVKAG